jgi:type VI secretion system secreted protein Hcp
MMRKIFLSMIVAFAAMAVSPAFAETGYMRLSIEGIGEVKGEATAAGREGMIEVHGFSHEVVSPRDAASGLPSGKRQHKPLVLTKPIDKSSPFLSRALNEKLKLTTLQLDLPAPAGDGTTEHFFTVEISEGRIAAIEKKGRTEVVTITYESIQRIE